MLIDEYVEVVANKGFINNYKHLFDRPLHIGELAQRQ